MCECVCVCLTQLSYKRIRGLKCPFFMIRNGQFHWDWKASHSHCIWMSARPIHVAFHSCWFTLEGVCCCCEEIWQKSVLPLRRNFVKEDKGVWRRRIYRKYASYRWLKNAGLEFTRRRSFKHVTWSSWPMVSRDWILSVRHLCGNKWHTTQIIYSGVKSYNGNNSVVCSSSNRI